MTFNCAVLYRGYTTAFAKKSSSSGGTSSSAVDDIHRILWQPLVYSEDHKTTLGISTLRRMDPINIVTSCFKTFWFGSFAIPARLLHFNFPQYQHGGARTGIVKETLAPFDLGF